MSRSASAIDLEIFRGDQDIAADHDSSSPYER
jgi:hypothetical protein